MPRLWPGPSAHRTAGGRGYGGSSQPPAAPVIALGTTFTIGGMITWAAVPGATAYDAYRDGVLATAGVTSPYSVVGGASGGDIGPTWTLKARNGAGSSAASNALSWGTPTSHGAIVDLIADSAFLTLVSTKVQTWVDRTANANSPIQSTAGNRPTVGSAIFNGKDAVLFASASATYLDLASITNLGGLSPQITIAFALKWIGDPAAAAGAVVSLNPAGTPWEALHLSGDGKMRANLGGASSAVSGTADASNSTHRYIARRSNVSTNTIKLQRDGVDQTPVTSTLTALAVARMAIGGRTGVVNIDAYVRAVAIYASTLSDADTADLDAYLAWTVS